MDNNYNNLRQSFRESQISSLNYKTSLANNNQNSKKNNSKKIYLEKNMQLTMTQNITKVVILKNPNKQKNI